MPNVCVCSRRTRNTSQVDRRMVSSAVIPLFTTGWQPRRRNEDSASHPPKDFKKMTSGNARLQQYLNRELPDVQAGFIKGRGTRDQIANIRSIIKKAREFQKNIYFCFTDCAKTFDCVDQNKPWKILKELGITEHLTCLLRNLCMQVKKQRLDLDMEQQTVSK